MTMQRRSFIAAVAGLASSLGLPSWLWGGGPRVYALEDIPAVPMVGDKCWVFLQNDTQGTGIGIQHLDIFNGLAGAGGFDTSRFKRVEMTCLAVRPNGIAELHYRSDDGMAMGSLHAKRGEPLVDGGAAVDIYAFTLLHSANGERLSDETSVSGTTSIAFGTGWNLEISPPVYGTKCGEDAEQQSVFWGA